MTAPPHENPLAILVRPREELRVSQNSLEVNIAEDSLGSHSQPAAHLPPLPRSQTMDSTGWNSPPATPPPESETESHFMDGIGCLFPTALPSRATSLSMGGDSDPDTPASTDSAAAAQVVENAPEIHGLPILKNDDFLATPRPNLGTWDAPARSAVLGASTFGSVLPLTPGLTPKRKREPSSPSSPPPAKRVRSQTLRADQEFHSARQLTMHLLGSTSGGSVEVPEAEQQEEVLESANASSVTWSLLSGQVEGEVSEGELGRLPSTADPQLTAPPDEGYSSSDTMPAPRTTTTNPAPLHALEVEFLSEDEIESHLAELVRAYRAFHLDPDENDPTEHQQPPDSVRAAASRDTLRAVFARQLRSIEDERRLLLRGEEEDVLNALSAWVRETTAATTTATTQGAPARGIRRETFQDAGACLERLQAATGERFVKRIW